MRVGLLKRKLSPFQMILLGFAVVILLGALLLVLPVASKTGGGTSFLDALFTSASAVCVTGLVVFDTATKWTLFGQIVILVLIQIGGIGVVTLATSLAVLSGKKIGIYGRETVKNALSAPNVGGVVRLTSFVVKGCFIVELIGVLALLPVFCRDFGAEGIWLAIFHSVSAFCNAGFDLMGDKTGEFSSFTGYAAQPVVNATLILLIVVGGIGFLVWEDVCRNKWRVNRYRTQSKVVLLTSAILIVFPALYFFFFEFGGLPFGRLLAVSVFQAVTPRTAGFNTADVAGFGDAGRGVLTVLMLVGSSPGSTAGGMKTTTDPASVSDHLLLRRDGHQRGRGAAHRGMSVRGGVCGRDGGADHRDHADARRRVQTDFDRFHVFRPRGRAHADLRGVRRREKAALKTAVGYGGGRIRR